MFPKPVLEARIFQLLAEYAHFQTVSIFFQNFQSVLFYGEDAASNVSSVGPI